MPQSLTLAQGLGRTLAADHAEDSGSPSSGQCKLQGRPGCCAHLEVGAWEPCYQMAPGEATGLGATRPVSEELEDERLLGKASWGTPAPVGSVLGTSLAV